MSTYIDGSITKMAPSRSTQNLTSAKMELVTKSETENKIPPRYYPGFNTSANSFRFGTPDTRASYSERRLMNIRPTTHNHPVQSSTNGPNRNADEKNGRCMSVSLAALNRSNGSLATDTDPNGNNKQRARAQTQGNSNTPTTPVTPNGGKRRDFGSHGSLDALTSGPERESFFALLRDLGAQSSSSSNGSSHVASRSSPERDVDTKPVGCAPSRLAELLRPNFNRGVVTNIHGPAPESLTSSGSVSMSVVQQQSIMTRRSTPEPVANNVPVSHQSRSATLPAESCSPKPRSKFQKFWERDRSKEKASVPVAVTTNTILPNATSRSASEPSIFKRLRGGSGVVSKPVNGASASLEPELSERDNSDAEARLEERLKRKAFAHHDCQSMSVNLGYAARLRGLLAQRRNTTTGASAASMAATGNGNKTHGKLKQQLTYPQETPPSGSSNPSEEADIGDGKANHLLLNCPFFRNELGGEPEWCVSLSRNSGLQSQEPHLLPHLLHRPVSTYGVSVLEFLSGKTHWRHGICPYQKQPSILERGDQGAFYYGTHFYGQEHQNWFGMDDTLGPIAISVRREKVMNDDGDGTSQRDQYMYRIIIRTSELATVRGTVLEDAIPFMKPPGPKGLPLREVFDMVAPEIQLSCLRLAIPGSTTEQQLLKLDQQGLSNYYKVGILYCKANQSTEEEMYNNEEGGPAFEEFLDLIGQRVRLRGFDKYKAGLDNKMDSTGLYSVYSQFQGCEVMFHVSTLLPFTPNNRQQLLRKRHIGNDIVTIVFQEPGALPFTPKHIRSQFQHVFIIIRVANPCTDHTQYQIAVSRSKEVPVFGPPIPAGATFPKSKSFVEFLLAKIINAEHAAHRSEKFATMATRTRQEYLKDLASNYVTASTLDSGSKFPILTFTSRKKERLKPKFIPDSIHRGAICWQVSVDDYSGGNGAVKQVECLLGISTDSIVLVEETTKDCIWAVSCKAILGWTSATSSIRLFYHQGECLTVHGRDSEADEIPEIVARLHAVTTGCGTRELNLRRNAVGQLGFHVQPDGLVTEVEPHGPAWQASLRQGCRLVEICKVTVATLSHEQIVDLLKTSSTVTVTVLPPIDPDTPRRGCTLQSCSYIVGSIDGEYDNVHNDVTCDYNSKSESGCFSTEGGGATAATRSAAAQQHFVSVHNRRLRYERSVSPPRSSSSSGYGTGSSSRSFSQGPGAVIVKDRFPANPEGTLTSTSSGHSSDDPWYDYMPEGNDPDVNPPTGKGYDSIGPPPLPSRPGGVNDRQRLRSGHSCEIFGPNSKLGMVESGTITGTAEGLKSCRSHDQIFHSTPENPSKTSGQSTYCTPSAKSKPLLESPSLVGRMNNYEDLKRLHTTSSVPGPQEPPKLDLSNKTRPPNPPDYHHAMQSRLVTLKSGNLPPEQINRGSGQSPSFTSRSEDELSAGSCNSLSPRSKRKHKNSNAGTLTPSSGSSRNHSPRLLVEAKLKPSATGSSSSSSNGSKNSQRGSTNLQEELLRLISPEEESRESKKSVIVTHARPAAVVANTSHSEIPAFPDTESLDWSSLVSAAARAIQGAASTMVVAQEGDDDDDESMSDIIGNRDSLSSWIDDVTEKLRLEAEAVAASPGKGSSVGLEEEVQLRMNQLEQHVGSLESRLRSEEDRRQALEAEIRRLRNDNLRLQGESQTAAQQLKRFTDWFFQTIERP